MMHGSSKSQQQCGRSTEFAFGARCDVREVLDRARDRLRVLSSSSPLGTECSRRCVLQAERRGRLICVDVSHGGQASRELQQRKSGFRKYWGMEVCLKIASGLVDSCDVRVGPLRKADALSKGEP